MQQRRVPEQPPRLALGPAHQRGVAVNYAAGCSPEATSIGSQIERSATAGLTKVRTVLERLVVGMRDAL
jgi:hypothetical protein